MRNLGEEIFCLATLLLLAFGIAGGAQGQSSHAQPLITQNIDESKLVTLHGNTRPEAVMANDRGVVPTDFPLDHMLLQLRRPAQSELALQQFLNDLQNPQSPVFHHWLTAQQFGEQFGLAQQDIDTVTNWLESYGFRVNVVYPSRLLIDFSGTAGEVEQAFHTSIHRLDVKGASHIANMHDPQIPAALAPAVLGIASLHDFLPHPMVKVRGQYTFSGSLSNVYAVVPGDLAKIYNFTPVFSSGNTGQGQTIVAVEDTDLYSQTDWSTFRSTFGLSGYLGTLSQVHPAPPSGSNNNCTDPRVNADDVEAELDVEYASAAAPGAAIEMASCSDTSTTFGGLIAMQNLVNSTTPPPILSVSYGECEAVNGAASNATYNSTYQQAAAEGVSVYVAAGDSGAAGCDQNQSAATHGIGVNAFASTPYDVAVGGTDFSDTYSGTNGTYWGSTNTGTYESALSYMPEIPWNDSCAGALLAAYEGYSIYGSNSFCNAAGGLLSALSGTTTTAAGGGGPSGCATGSPSTSGVVGGTCAGYAKPGWQAVFGNPSDGVRDTPDVSLFAANGLWSHYYIFCYSDTANGGTACTGSPSGWTGAGGTSFGAPIMAGVQALINEKAGASQGNPDPAFYSLAAGEYGTGGNPSCNSSLGNGVSSSCTFYDVTLGDMTVDCTGNQNCYDSSAGYGVLSTSSGSYAPAYGVAAGWDFASGIGSVNVANLVNNWPASSASPDFSLSASPTNLTITQGSQGTSTIAVNPFGGFTGSVSLSASAPAGVTWAFNPASATPTTNSTLTLTVSNVATPGTSTVTITGMSGGLSRSTTISLTVSSSSGTPSFTLSANAPSLTIHRGSSGTDVISISDAGGFSGSVSLSAAGQPQGVAASFSPNPATGSSTLTLKVNKRARVGTYNVTITGTSGSLSSSITISLTIS